MSSFSKEALEIECQGETLLLHPERVLFWPAQKILFVADVHAGKEHRFGRAGIAIPGGISDDVLTKLFALCVQSAAQRLIVLGDFMHSIPTVGESWLATLSYLLDENPHLSMDIVAGNHDKLTGQKLIDPRITWHADLLHLPPFVLKHEPDEHSEDFMLAGHIHPTWRLSQSRRLAVKAPVFWFRKHYAVLPAFGDFTGGVIIDPSPTTDSIYMVGPSCVINIPLNTKKSRPKRN